MEFVQTQCGEVEIFYTTSVKASYKGIGIDRRRSMYRVSHFK